MGAVTATIAAPRAQVWDALVDVRTYPTWLIGARKIRSIDDDWPAPGSAFHHVVGLGGPLTVADSTSSVAADAPHRLELVVRARPLLRATVVFTLEDTGGGTSVTVEEHPIGWHRLLAPVLSIPTMARNRASLERLEERVRERMRAAG